MLKEYLEIREDVKEALAKGRPVVALESTIIAHGMPYPQNVETALAVSQAVRQAGAVPATVGILGGRICVGLSEDQIVYLAKAQNVVKVSRRDFPYVCANGLDGATTVAGTMIAAEAAGIRVFVTGGIGGVHRGAGESFDISADLEEMKRTNVAVVCAGVKSILDIRATLEYLETAGVPVITFGADTFPSFYSRESDCRAECRMDSEEEIAALIRTKYDMELTGGVLVACPLPASEELPADVMETVIREALSECAVKGISGKKVTPYLLDRVKALTGGRSLEANIALVLNNARIGAEIAIKI